MKKPCKINIFSSKVRLNAYFYEGSGKGKKPTIIWLHGIPGGPEEGKNEIAKNLCKSGINVLRFNYQGFWGKGGKFTMENSLKDLSAVMNFLTRKENAVKFKTDTDRIILAGYSFGTAVALTGALNDERIVSIICIALCDYGYFGRQYKDPDSKIREFLKEAIDGVFSDKTIFNQDPKLFLEKLAENRNKYDIVRHAEKLLSKKILMICGMDDNVCPVENHLFPVYRRLRELEHKNLKLEIKNCGHELPGDLEEIICEWVKEN